MSKEHASSIEKASKSQSETAKTAEAFSKEQLFKTGGDIKAYEMWRNEIPASLRRLVESHVVGEPSHVDRDLTPLVGQYYRAFDRLLSGPDIDSKELAQELDLDQRVSAMLQGLQRIQLDESKAVNLFRLLSNPDFSFYIKKDYIQKKVLPRLEWLQRQDKKEHEEYDSKSSSVEVNPSEEPDEYEPHRSPSQETEGQPDALALVHPFYGGYYKDGVFAEFDSKRLKWKKTKRTHQELPAQHIDQEKKRTYQGAVSGGTSAVIKLPYGWGVDGTNITWLEDEPKNASFAYDQDGVVVLHTDEKKGTYPFRVEVGPTQNILPLENTPTGINKPGLALPDDLEKEIAALQAGSAPNIARARQLVRTIRSHLQYDKDDAGLDAQYKQKPHEYLRAIWAEGKAKCDEANTLACQALTKLGIPANFISGHSVNTKTEQGEAILANGNRHAWTEAWDDDGQRWVRLDATPEGDPNVDEEQQEEDLEGDYGEQEEPLMTDEELEDLLESAEEENEQGKKENPEIRFAEEAECSVEEAREFIRKIQNLRKRYKKELKESQKMWAEAVRKNYKKRLQYRGPVRMSEGDDLEDVVAARIGVKSGEADPIGWAKETRVTEEEKLFGGWEVYIAADMSGSMNNTIEGAVKAKQQRDMVFLLMESVSKAAAEVKKRSGKLKAEMPVRVSLVVFQGKQEVLGGENKLQGSRIVLPVTEDWGPKEQMQVYRELDKAAGGGTPDHEGLRIVREQIRASREHNKDEIEPNRFVITIADGGSDSSSVVRQAVEELEEEHIPTDLFLVASKDNSNLITASEKNYSSVSVVPNPKELARVGIKKLVEHLKEVYEL